MTFDSDTPISRRTVAKGIAWSVPAVMVAGATPAYAASPILPPVFSWALGCATVGNTQDGCANLAMTPQVPFTLTNSTLQTLQFQILGTKSWTDNDVEPTNFTTPVGIYKNNGTEDNCSPKYVTAGCDGIASVTLAPGESASLWLVGNTLTNSSAFWMKVQYRWIQTDCVTVVAQGIATPDEIIPNNNCA